MHSPSHPGELIREELLVRLGLTVTAAAAVLGVGRAALSAVLNGRVSLTPEMALRTEKAFSISMELLLKMQLQHDIAHTRRNSSKLKVARFKPAA